MKINSLPWIVPALRLSILRRLATGAWRLAIPLPVLGLCLAGGSFAFGAPTSDDAKALPKQEHIQSIYLEKFSRTPAQQKLESHLLFAVRKDRGEEPVPGVPTLVVGVPTGENGRVTVQIRANINADLLAAIEKNGGVVLNTFPDDGMISAAVPLQRLEKLSERDDVRFIQLPPQAESNFGPLDSEGDTTHDAIEARRRYNVDGTGVKIGVLSNGTKSLAKSQAAGELPGSVTVLSGQAGPTDKDEGTAMMEIVQDIAPGAQLFYATGSTGDLTMAANIRALKAAGCSIIVDDISYFNESPFQDGPVSQAVNEVSAAGVLYFSSAANSGNKDSNQASTWEGDFADGGTPPGPVSLATAHSFGPKNFNTNPSGDKTHVELFWNDPLKNSKNDYDLILTDDAGNVTDMSTNVQSGSQDPYEHIDSADKTTGKGRRGTRIYILKNIGAENRFLHLCTDRNPLEISTEGSTRGHSASGAPNAFSVAAAPANKAFDGTGSGNPAGPFPNPFTSSANFENFSSDGPRRIFYEADGTAITPTNLTATGGRVLHKPDITAADGVSTSVQDFAPFFGTSAAAPHAGAIAALLKSKFPNASAAEVRNALMSTALDIGAAGIDRDSGAGIIMPRAAMNLLGPPPAEIALVGPAPDYPDNPNQAVQKPTNLLATVTVNLRITAAPAGGQVHIFTKDGTARCAFPYTEYDCIDQIVYFNMGDSIVPFQIRVYATPNFASGNGNFTVNLDQSVNGTIIRAKALITIIDTAAPNVSLSVADTQVIESAPDVPVPGGTVNAEFLVTLSQASDRPVTVNAATSDASAKAGTDYKATQANLIFAPGETEKVVSVPVFNTPDRNKPEQTFNLVLSTPINAQISKQAAICTVHQPVTPGPAINIATRMRVLTNDNVLIGGFIVTGTEPKKVIVRGIGPSLSGLLSGTLVDPVLQLFSGNTVLGSNDNWKINDQNGQSQEAEIRATTIPPSNDKESAIVATLNPGAYTAILSGKNSGQGVGVVEVYDLSPRSQSELANIATRGFVDSGDNVMIGGFIVGVNAESADSRVIIRGIGPSLPIAGALKDPTLELHNGSGTLLASNDNWKVSESGQSQEAEVRFTQIPPSKDLESAIVTNLARGQYTAILRGKNGGTGIGLIEVYKIN